MKITVKQLKTLVENTVRKVLRENGMPGKVVPGIQQHAGPVIGTTPDGKTVKVPMGKSLAVLDYPKNKPAEVLVDVDGVQVFLPKANVMRL